MAILNKIRSKAIFLIAIIALALFAFIFSDIITKSGSFDSKQNTVATVNGVDIDREEFARKVELQSRRQGANGTNTRAVNTVWNQELERAVLNEQYEALGIQVSDERLQELLKEGLESNPNFQDAEGFFSVGKMQEYIASVKGTDAYASWVGYEQDLIATEKRTIYENLIKAGVGATLKDGEVAYKMDGNTIDIQYVQIPYSTIADEDVEVTKTDITAYINAHKDEFESEATRSIRYVKFDEQATLEDENELKAQMAKLITDNILPDGRILDDKGLSEVGEDDIAQFIDENSDVKYFDRYFFKNQLPAAGRDTLFTMEAGAVYGPYKDGTNMKLTRVVETKQMPDSLLTKHILVSYQGATRSVETRTKEEAQKLADSIFTVVKRNKGKFADLAASFSSDASNKDKGGELNWFSPTDNFAEEFRDYVLDNRVGDMDVVETDFGFHVINILDKKNSQKAMKVATVVKEILPSEKTIGDVYSTTQNFEIAARKGDFAEVAQEKGYTPRPVNAMKPMDELLPGEGSQRPIVQWAFEEETNVGDVKRFQVNDGYIVAQVTKRTKKGLLSAEDASTRVTPIVRNQKKAALIKSRITSTDLNEMSSNQGQSVKTAGALNMKNPTIAGAGREPKVVGAAFGLAEGATSDLIEGDRGVYRVRVSKVTEATALDNYAAFANQATQAARSGVSTQVVNALKNAADVEDNRATFY